MTVIAELKETELTCGEGQIVNQDMVKWRKVITVSCPSRDEKERIDA